MGWSYWRATHAQGNEASATWKTSCSSSWRPTQSRLPMAKEVLMHAEEISRAIGPVGSHALVDALLSLQRKNLLLFANTDEHDQHRKLFYLVKTVRSTSEP